LSKLLFTLSELQRPIHYGHLSSHNIFIELQNDENEVPLKVFLADIELIHFLKYANTFYDYNDLTVWSSPECLLSQKKMLDPTLSMDVYSFGIVLWELYHESIPFDNDL
jgi:hypothetical protein